MCMDCEQESFACNEVKQRTAFSATYAELLKVRAQMEANEEETDEESNALLDRESELVRTLCGMPAVVGWQALRKLELALTYHDRSEWADQRDIRLLNSIRADLQVLLR